MKLLKFFGLLELVFLIDLCWRAQNKGFQIKCVGASTVFHVGGATLKEGHPRKTYLNFRNSLLTLLKNVPSKYVFQAIFFRMVLDGVAAIKFIFELKPMHTFAILRSHLSFYKNIFKYLKKRKQLPQKANYYRHFSIVWQYFISGRKKYKDLVKK